MDNEIAVQPVEKNSDGGESLKEVLFLYELLPHHSALSKITVPFGSRILIAVPFSIM
jgi:hypothetical protein